MCLRQPIYGEESGEPKSHPGRGQMKDEHKFRRSATDQKDHEPMST